jgi:hypothetical protein
LGFSKIYRIFATAFGGLGKSQHALVKSSLVFVLVEGWQLPALKFYKKTKIDL